MEGILYVLLLLLALLFIVLLGLLQYVILPWAVLRAFFRSEWAPQALKDIVGWTLGVLMLLCVGFLGWSWHRQAQARQQVEVQRRWPPIHLTVQQPGLLPYPLGRGRIEQARYPPAPVLVVAGDLVVEGRLRAWFTAGPGVTSPNEANIVRVSTEKGDATHATGRAVFDPRTRTVSGSFHCVLPAGKQVFISFPSTPTAVE
jgi:hypothetical protein